MQKRKINIFFIHSDYEFSKAYKVRLELEGFAVAMFSDHDSALAHIAAVQPSLIIVGEKIGTVSAKQFLDLLDDPVIGQGIPTLVIAEGSYSNQKDGTGNNYIPKTAASSATVIAKINELLGQTTSRR